MAVNQDGDIIETQESLWKKEDLTHAKNATTQGDV